MRSARRFAGAAIVATVLGLSLVAQASAGVKVVLDERAFDSATSSTAFAGATGATALHLRALGQELTIADGGGTANFGLRRVVESVPSLDGDLLAPCDAPDAVNIEGSRKCLQADVLRSRGIQVADINPQVSVQQLVDAGLAELVTRSEGHAVSDQTAEARVSGLLVPGLSAAEATCTAARPTDSVVDKAIEAPLDLVIAGHLAFASCETSREPFPALSHRSGEAVLDLTLTRSLLQELDAAAGPAFEAVRGLAGTLSEPLGIGLDAAVDRVVTSLQTQPAAKIRVAPTRGEIIGSNPSMTATSIAQGATIDLLPLSNLPLGQLDGVVQITVGEASTTTSIVDGVPSATNRAAVVNVKMLDVADLVPDETLVDLDIPPIPGLSETILANTPLQTTIKVADAPTPVTECTEDGDVTRCVARAEATSLQISIFDPVLADGSENPLGMANVALELAGANSEVLASISSGRGDPGLPVVLSETKGRLPDTGPLPYAAVGGGIGLVGLAAAARRRLLG